MDDEEKLHEFLKVEYSAIAQAHFDVSGRVTTFFQYLLLIYSAVFIFLSSDTLKAADIEPIKGYIFIAIGAIGIFIMLYISHLRFEAILYARHINGIRRRFYNDLKQNYDTIQQTMLLPGQMTKPKYLDGPQFVFLVFAIWLMNTAYFFMGLNALNSTPRMKCILLICAFGFQVSAYLFYAHRNERGKSLYNPIIGVDIDGVIANHTIQFCHVFNKLNPQSEIAPEQIVKIPVHKSNIGITEEQEREVFQQREYWTTMPVIEGAMHEIRRIKDKLGFKIYIFTWRHWKVHEENLEKITKGWLEKAFGGKFYDRIYFEKGNLFSPVSSRKYRKNRYSFCMKHNIMFFVEDNTDNAIRLSNIVKFVFLLDQPYNRNCILPFNVIRVQNWNEIEDLIIKLL